MYVELAISLLRHLLTAAGTLLVTKGVFDAGTVEQAVGAVMVLIGLVGSYFNKVNAKAKVEKAAATPVAE